MKEMVGGCCVCSDERGWAENPLVYCDGQGCNVAVHQACYGIVTVPTGPWFCRKCESQERAARVKNKLRESLTIRNFQQRCELCPSKDGALKRTDNAGWAHVVCALYIPEVRFGNVTTMEPIILQLVPPERFNKSCYICEEQGKESKSTIGACMQCNKSGCKQHFHVTCAQAAGLLCEEAGNYMDNVKYCGYCQYHYQKLRLSSIRSGLLGKKGNSIKTIPAFKPIPADNATPDSTPEKNSPPSHDGIKEKVKLARNERKTLKNGMTTMASPNVIAETLSATSFSDNSNSSTGNSNRADGGNSVIVSSSGGNLVGKFTTANFTETVITHSGSVFGSAEKASKKKKNIVGSSNSLNRASLINSTNNAGMVNFQNMDGDVMGDDDVSFSTSDTGSETVKTTVSDSALAEKSVSAVTSSLLGATPSGSFTSAYENFLSGSYPGITSEGDANLKRQRSHSSDRIEKKKHKKGSGSSKKSKKKKEHAANGVGLDFVKMNYGGGADHNYYRSYASSEVNTNGVMSAQELAANQANMFFPACSLQEPKKAPEDEKIAMQVNNAESAHGQLPDNHEMPMPQPNGSVPMPSIANLPRFGMSAPTSSRGVSSSTTTQFPQSLEQLLERQWEQGSQFLMEQAQHFDIASLLSCLHQLRVENHRLEDHVNALVSRRDHLLAVNARLSLSLSATHSTGSSLNEASRLSRISNFIPTDNVNPLSQERNFQHRSPSQSVSPGHAASPVMNSLHSLIANNTTPPHSMAPSSLVGMMSSLPHPSSALMQSVIGQAPPLVSNHGHVMNSTPLNGSPSIRCSSAQSSYLSSCSSSHSSLPSPLMSHLPVDSSEHLRLQQQGASSSSPYPMYPGIPNTTYMGMPNSGQNTMASSTPVSVVMSVTAQQAHSHASGKKNNLEFADHNSSVSDKR